MSITSHPHIRPFEGLGLSIDSVRSYACGL